MVLRIRKRVENLMDEKEYLTVAEYARLRGVSTASVYKRLDKSLKPWVRVINGKKCLLTTVLTDLPDDSTQQVDNVVNNIPAESVNVENEEPEEVENPGPEIDNVENRKNVEKAEVINGVENRVIEVLTAEIERLRSENQEQRDIIREKDHQLQDFAMRFASLAEQAQTLAGQAQALHAADKKPALIAAAEEEQAETALAVTEQPFQPEDARQQDPEPRRKRRSFWQWLTGE